MRINHVMASGPDTLTHQYSFCNELSISCTDDMDQITLNRLPQNIAYPHTVCVFLM